MKRALEVLIILAFRPVKNDLISFVHIGLTGNSSSKLRHIYWSVVDKFTVVSYLGFGFQWLYHKFTALDGFMGDSLD